jgi:MSHA biogenesis protein MshN
MSIINQMLRDLDARHASEQERAGLPSRLRTLPPQQVARSGQWRTLVVGMLAGGALVGVAASWYFSSGLIPPAPVPAPVPAAAPAPAPAAPSVPPAPTSAAPAPQAEAVDMKLSTLLANAKPEPTVAAPPPAKPVASPAPRPAVVAKAPESAKPAEPVPAPAKPVSDPKPVPPAGKPAAEPPKPARESRPAPAPVAETMPADAQIDKRQKGGQAHEMAESEYRKGMQAVRRNDNAGAVPLFKHALELDPGHAKARQALLSVLVASRQWAEAQLVAKSGLALDPAQTGWATILARLQFEQGDAAAAILTLESYAVHAGGDADYQGLFAYLLQKQQRPAEAAQRFRVALALRPGEGRWWFGLGLALEAAGQGGDAKDAYAKAREVGNLPADMLGVVEQKLR